MAPAAPESAKPPAPGPDAAAGAPAPAATSPGGDVAGSPDWAGLPAPALALVAAQLAADAERAAAFLPKEQLRYWWSGGHSSKAIRGGGYSHWRDDRGADPDQQRDGLLAFATTCKSFRAAQVQLGGQLRTRVGGLMRHQREDVLGLLLWAVREAGCPTVEATAETTRMTLTAVAALWGNLPALKRLHEEGFEWNEQTPAAAAETGQLDVLQVPSIAGIEGRGSRLTDASRFTLTVASSRRPSLSALPLG